MQVRAQLRGYLVGAGGYRQVAFRRAHKGSGFAWRGVSGALLLATRRRHGRQQEERQARPGRRCTEVRFGVGVPPCRAATGSASWRCRSHHYTAGQKAMSSILAGSITRVGNLVWPGILCTYFDLIQRLRMVQGAMRHLTYRRNEVAKLAFTTLGVGDSARRASRVRCPQASSTHVHVVS